MKKDVLFYLCKDCGEVIEVVVGEAADFICNGKEMVKLEANTTDAAGEKHVPVIEQNGNKVVVKVGSVPHPMEEKHHIAFVTLVTEKGHQRFDLPVDGEPVAEFTVADDDKVVCAYEFCNLHGLWKAEA